MVVNKEILDATRSKLKTYRISQAISRCVVSLGEMWNTSLEQRSVHRFCELD